MIIQQQWQETFTSFWSWSLSRCLHAWLTACNTVPLRSNLSNSLLKLTSFFTESTFYCSVWVAYNTPIFVYRILSNVNNELGDITVNQHSSENLFSSNVMRKLPPALSVAGFYVHCFRTFYWRVAAPPVFLVGYRSL